MLSAAARIWMCLEPVDMRLSFDGLAARIQHQLQRDPYGGECFVFRSKDGSRAKALLWDGLWFWLHYRRLEKGRFVVAAWQCRMFQRESVDAGRKLTTKRG